ncbi:hypothetical protein F5B21DRAFT_6789 [Xylaria acuta]|nr:hypothetical protein F5B21DRAFT_6789 [Xylaria acuta]
MPPPCSEQRCSRHIGRRSRVSRAITRPRLLTGESLNDADEKAEESEENVSPDAEKSEIRFTLQRRDGDGDEDNGGNNRDSDRPGRDRGGGDNNQDRRNGREGDSNGQGSRFRGGGGGPPPFFREENDGGGGRPGDNGGGNGNGKGPGGDGGRGGNGRGGNNNNEEDGGNRGGGDNGGDGNGDNKDGNDNDNGRGGKGEGEGGSGDDRGGSDSEPDDTSSSSPPPPPSSTTTVESTTVEVSTTTSVVSTSTPAPEVTTATTPSVLETNSITLLTPLPALADTVPTSSALPNSATPDGALGTSQTLTSVSPTNVVDSTTPVPTQTSTSLVNGFKGEGRHHGNSDNNNKGNDKEGGLNPISEQILVAAGAIGVFIVFCFVGWTIYRTLKKSKQSGRGNNSESWLSKLIPWRRMSAESNAQASDGSYEPKEPLPAYDFGNNNSMEAFGYYDQGKFYPFGSEGMTYQPTATLQNGRVVWQSPEVQQPLQPQASLQNQYPQTNDQTIDISDVNSTIRSRMPDPYYNQSEFARQPSDAYNPAQRQVYRASEISSLSSGFGDGDIIMPPPNVMPKPPVTQATSNTDTSNRPFSWMSRAGTEKRRESTTTTASERPPRFRSVNSWVDQQKERLKRANSRRAREEVPAIPQISYK